MAWIGFTTAVSGLLSSQKSLYTTNHNISNMNTEGYSRQKAAQNATNPLKLPGIGMLGTGTTITEINRVRDSYINSKYWGENGPSGEWKVKQETLGEIEKVFNEPSESAIRKNMDEFFNALEDLSKNPSDNAYRQAVMEKAVTLTEHINETANKLYNVQKELNFAISTQVKQVNDMAEQIQRLNKQIFNMEIDGSNANDLRDRRDYIVDKLSEIVNVQVDESTDGKYRVSIGGMSLVDHTEVSKLKYPPNIKENPLNPTEKLVQVQWETGNQPVNLKGGEMKGLLEIRDGDGLNGEYRGIPFYINRLNEFSQKIFEKINEQHYQGQGLNGKSKKFFFTINDKMTSDLGVTDPNDSNYKDWIKENVKADNISLSGDILGDLDNIAAASTDQGVEDNGNIKAIIELRENKTFFDDTIPQGTPEDFVKSILSNVAVDGQQAKRMYDNQRAIVENIVIRREAESGVSLNEEVGDMIRFQQSYNASARMITTIDAIYDVTINRLGLVGR
ncbi:flagellar hook-associated protein FlgK [Clostridiisalibacter paucivorans]|uniref:flagellar hook-associated protein FlgK n=1 Tax=Clostridiisalibacter paucivorans TaxID=408753 RepID=UPI00054D220E|nr:flagellar hook-associated protein FlgK [Clostridiisalibacter paucivorans]